MQAVAALVVGVIIVLAVPALIFWFEDRQENESE